MTKDPQPLTNGSKQLPGIDRNQLTEKMLEGGQPRTGLMPPWSQLILLLGSFCQGGYQFVAQT